MDWSMSLCSRSSLCHLCDFSFFTERERETFFLDGCVRNLQRTVEGFGFRACSNFLNRFQIKFTCVFEFGKQFLLKKKKKEIEREIALLIIYILFRDCLKFRIEKR
jgi:hypothetical protein